MKPRTKPKPQDNQENDDNERPEFGGELETSDEYDDAQAKLCPVCGADWDDGNACDHLLLCADTYPVIYLSDRIGTFENPFAEANIAGGTLAEENFSYVLCDLHESLKGFMCVFLTRRLSSIGIVDELPKRLQTAITRLADTLRYDGDKLVVCDERSDDIEFDYMREVVCDAGAEIQMTQFDSDPAPGISYRWESFWVEDTARRASSIISTVESDMAHLDELHKQLAAKD